MQKGGTKSKYPKELIEKAVQDYLTNDLTAKDTAEKYGIPEHTLLYWKRKEVSKDGIKRG